MKMVSHHIPGYDFGAVEVKTSPVSMKELESLKASVGFTEEDRLFCRWRAKYLEIRPSK